jgi:WS/DGAT/MGAT family acyltransferase
MSAQDASFIYAESKSGPLHIGSVNIFDGPIDYDELYTHMSARMHLLPRYRQRLAFVPLNLAHATLEDDPDFDLHNHLKQVSLPDGIDERAFLAEAMKEFAPILDRRRPLWQMLLFNGLAHNRSAVVWKVHHCLVDGVSGMELLTISLDLKPGAGEPPAPTRPFQPSPVSSAFRRMTDAAVDLIKQRLEESRRIAASLEAPGEAAAEAAALANAAGRLLQLLSRLSRPIVAAPWNSSLIDSKRQLAALIIPFAEVRSIRHSLGGTVNDVVLAILSEAAARYLAHHDFRGPFAPMRIGCPVNVRRQHESGALGNRVSMMFPEFPSIPLTVEDRMAAVIRETTRVKAAEEPQALDRLLAISEAIPPALAGLTSMVATTMLDAAAQIGGSRALGGLAALPAPGINFIATNVPGAQVPLYLAGRRMLQMIGCVPLSANLGYNVAIVSYDQNLIFGMMASPRLMPDVELMRDLASDVFAELLRLAQQQKSAAVTSRSGGPKLRENYANGPLAGED